MSDPGEQTTEEAVARFSSVWKICVGDRKNPDLQDHPGIVVCWADSLFSTWNVLLLSEQISNLDVLQARLRDAAAYMRAKKQPGMVFFCDDFVIGAARAGFEEAAASERLKIGSTFNTMVGDILPLDAPGHRSPRFERVGDQAALQVYADLSSKAYNLPPEAMRDGLLGSQLWIDDAFSFVAFDPSGQSVSVASVLPHDGSLHLALVGTRPDARKQGFCKATVRHALQEAHLATGLRQTDLHASDMAVSTYRRIGYQPTTKFHSFVLDQ